MKELGKGRSGIVFANENKPVAHKIFVGSKLANLVHYFFSGAPNPYIWNKHAIRCALLRRNILTKLVEFWFEGKATVADGSLTMWNEKYQAYELQAELVNGEPALLQHPFYEEKKNNFNALIKEIMQPLQKKLIESGFDGLVWQAGLGNPVAANNFLYEDKWIWIDLESGVPALIPLNPIPLFSFYLPKSWHHKCALFDDIDVPKLQKYLQENNSALLSYMEKSTHDDVVLKVEELGREQNLWKRTTRIDRSLSYNLAKKRITQEQFEFYKKIPPFWYAKELWRLLLTFFALLLYRIPAKLAKKLLSYNYWRLAKKALKFLISQKYREEKAQNYVVKQIKRWKQRKQFSETVANDLEKSTFKEGSSAFITDFGVHVAMKPFVKIFEYVIVPLLFIGGSIGGIALPALLVIIAGPLARSTYTLGRILQAQVKMQKKPWIALFIGLFPVVGNLAYPTQMLYSASSEDKVAAFILYDTIGKFGQYMPIWGGEDTGTEHFFNQLAHHFLRRF